MDNHSPIRARTDIRGARGDLQIYSITVYTRDDEEAIELREEREGMAFLEKLPAHRRSTGGSQRA